MLCSIARGYVTRIPLAKNFARENDYKVGNKFFSVQTGKHSSETKMKFAQDKEMKLGGYDSRKNELNVCL